VSESAGRVVAHRFQIVATQGPWVLERGPSKYGTCVRNQVQYENLVPEQLLVDCERSNRTLLATSRDNFAQLQDAESKLARAIPTVTDKAVYRALKARREYLRDADHAEIYNVVEHEAMRAALAAALQENEV
jgi:hypothetical protein